jgi:hypothetical protein
MNLIPGDAMGITENSANQVTDPELQGNAPPGAQGTTPRGRDPILDRNHLGEEPDAPGQPAPPPPDSDDGASKDPRDAGNNGNAAQSAGRVTMEEQNKAPEKPENINTEKDA